MMKLTDKGLVLPGIYKEQIFVVNGSSFLGVLCLLESDIYLREVSSPQ